MLQREAKKVMISIFKTIFFLVRFASPEIMYQYGLLLEDYEGNGEFVNDCIFTLMHHVGGELGSLISLFQPKILKIFTAIWKSEFEICDVGIFFNYYNARLLYRLVVD